MFLFEYVLLNYFQQYMLKYNKNFFSWIWPDKMGYVLHACASYTALNTVFGGK